MNRPQPPQRPPQQIGEIAKLGRVDGGERSAVALRHEPNFARMLRRERNKCDEMLAFLDDPLLLLKLEHELVAGRTAAVLAAIARTPLRHAGHPRRNERKPNHLCMWVRQRGPAGAAMVAEQQRSLDARLPHEMLKSIKIGGGDRRDFGIGK